MARDRTAMRAVEKHLRPKQLTDITADAIGKLKAGMRADGGAPATVASNLRHLLRGLWLSGLRTGEAMGPTWDDRDSAHVRLGGPFPALLIPGRLQKGGKDTVTPITPDLLKFLRQTPEADRTGLVFDPAGARGKSRPAASWVSRTVSAVGAAGGLDVKDGETPKAHDLRRSFCFRWAQRVLPQQLKVLARHSAVQTTLTYYAEADAGMTAEAVAAAVAGFEDD